MTDDSVGLRPSPGTPEGERRHLTGQPAPVLRAEADLLDAIKDLTAAEKALVKDVLLKDALWTLTDQHRWPWLAEAHREASVLLERRQQAVRTAENAIATAERTLANYGVSPSHLAGDAR